MIKVKRAVVTEGKYDKIKLSGLIDGIIIKTDGFGVFKDKEKQSLIKALAQSVGLIVITDSDVAGFKIRNFIKSIAPSGDIINLYIPQISGKEKRKASPSKEGTLGVEGIDEKILLDIFKKSGVDAEISSESPSQRKITKLDFYNMGLTGKENSKALRLRLLDELNLPEYLSANALLEIINTLLSYDEFIKITEKLKS